MKDPPVLERSRPTVSVLDFEVDEILAFLRERLLRAGVAEAYLMGSVAAGTAGPWSDLDVVVVQETDEPFVERPRAFADLHDLGVPVDVLVYTPEELKRLRAEGSGFWRAFEACHRRIV